MNRSQWLLYFGLLIFGIFGGQFVIRLMRDGDFFIAEFIIGFIGLILLIISLCTKKTYHHGKEDFE